MCEPRFLTPAQRPALHAHETFGRRERSARNSWELRGESNVFSPSAGTCHGTTRELEGLPEAVAADEAFCVIREAMRKTDIWWGSPAWCNEQADVDE